MTVVETMMATLRAQVCGDSMPSIGEVSEEKLRALYTVSKAHDVTHLVAAELSTRGLLGTESELCEKLRKQHLLSVLRYERIGYELSELYRILEEEAIPFIPLKGSVIRSAYPEPWMRTSCDIDILVHPEDLERASTVIQEKLQYAFHKKASHDVSMFSESGVHLELHFDLVEDGRANACRSILTRAWTFASPVSLGSAEHRFSDEMFYFYHIAHMAKHFEEGGCGLRPFLDLWILNHRMDRNDERRRALLEEGNLLKFEQEAVYLSEVWFGDAPHTDTSRLLERFVLAGGSFGSTETHVAMTRTRKSGKVGYLLNRIWMPYEKLQYQYPVIRKHRWLTPLAQVRRWFRLVFRGKLKSSLTELNANASFSEEQQTETRALLSQLGLN